LPTSYILNEQHDRKIAVIMNEFGDTAGIDCVCG
jgi:G3E family GTPase